MLYKEIGKGNLKILFIKKTFKKRHFNWFNNSKGVGIMFYKIKNHNLMNLFLFTFLTIRAVILFSNNCNSYGKVIFIISLFFEKRFIYLTCFLLKVSKKENLQFRGKKLFSPFFRNYFVFSLSNTFIHSYSHGIVKEYVKTCINEIR